MATKPVYDDDLPDMHTEPDPPPPQIMVTAEDLKPGPAEVKSYDRNAWVKEFGPKPPGPGMRTMDFVIVGMLAGTVALFVKACSWAWFS